MRTLELMLVVCSWLSKYGGSRREMLISMDVKVEECLIPLPTLDIHN